MRRHSRPNSRATPDSLLGHENPEMLILLPGRDGPDPIRYVPTGEEDTISTGTA